MTIQSTEFFIWTFLVLSNCLTINREIHEEIERLYLMAGFRLEVEAASDSDAKLVDNDFYSLLKIMWEF